MKVGRRNAPLPAGDDAGISRLPEVVTRASPAATAVALTGMLGLAAACWVIAIRQMSGMDMGTATRLGSFAFFIAVWVAMMAAMMLPGAAPAALRRARAAGARAVPLFAAAYLAVWTLAGAAVYVAYRPHGTLAAGAIVIAAAIYEMTPLKRNFRRRCLEANGSGFTFGLCCAGSSAGLMAVLLALGVMSVTWMVVIAVLALAQKLLPDRTAIDLPLALTIAVLGVLIVVTPALIPGLHPPM